MYRYLSNITPLEVGESERARGGGALIFRMLEFDHGPRVPERTELWREENG